MSMPSLPVSHGEEWTGGEPEGGGDGSQSPSHPSQPLRERLILELRPNVLIVAI